MLQNIFVMANWENVLSFLVIALVKLLVLIGKNSSGENHHRQKNRQRCIKIWEYKMSLVQYKNKGSYTKNFSKTKGVCAISPIYHLKL